MISLKVVQEEKNKKKMTTEGEREGRVGTVQEELHYKFSTDEAADMGDSFS